MFPVQGTPINISTALSDNTFEINGMEYRELISGNYCSDIEWQYSIGYMRSQDSSWYFTYGGNEPEELYFKFNAVVGEIFNGYSWIENDALIVEAIDSVQLLDGSMRKRIILNNIDPEYPYNQYWIEGIGSQQMGIRFPTYMGGLWHHWEDLRCFLIDETTVFSNISSPCCLVVGIDESVTNNKVETFPNPASDRLNIQFPYSEKWHVSIYNMQGALVKEEHANQLLPYSVDIQQLATGIYTILCKDEKGKTFVEKVVRQ